MPPASHDELPRYLRCIDVFVLPSRSTPRWKEQFGMTLAQAMMAGCACIGTDSGAIPEVLKGSGTIVPEGNPTSLALAIKSLVIDPTLRADFSGQAKETALKHYTNDTVAQTYIEALNAIATSPVGSR
jgi:glycosyltransferase involved in cell wall biosynthesis